MHRRTLLGLMAATAAAPGCATPRTDRSRPSPVLRFDYSAVELLAAAYERTSITEAELDALLANRGVRAMVDNTIKYIPQPLEAFRSAMREHVETRQVTTGRFGLTTSVRRLHHARAVMAAIKAREAELIERVNATIAPLWPAPDPLTATCYFVLAGASDGFVLDNDTAHDCFVALDRTEGVEDVDGVMVNVAHEFYHVAQKAAVQRAGLADEFNLSSAPPLTRLLLSVLYEGSANYAVDPARMTGTGPYFTMWRERFIRNAAPERVSENFALFDRIFSALDRNELSWEAAYSEGFGGNNDARLYFVGYEMMRALHHNISAESVRAAFGRRPESVFADFIALTRRDLSLPRFAADTEARLLQLA